ncbi:metal-dependent phosphohydrolase [Halobacteriales archaeon QS_5_70_15]|nr:MAG: metal-dependent phosphohydrolase [Halobacteriales archaeon QS_5_70_15]
MTGSRHDHVEATFPELEEISDPGLRERTAEAWVLAMEENGVDDLSQVPWRPPDQERLALGEEWLVDHVREVAAGGLALAELLESRRDADIDTDVVVAGALVHDVSKLYEFHGFDETEIGDLLGHPYYGVYVAGSVGLPPEIVAITVNHTGVTNVEPATVEAALVRQADHASAAAIWGQGGRDLREA